MTSHRWVELITVHPQLVDQHPSVAHEVAQWAARAAQDAGAAPEAIRAGSVVRYGYSVPLESPEMPGPGYDAQTRRATVHDGHAD